MLLPIYKHTKMQLNVKGCYLNNEDRITKKRRKDNFNFLDKI